MNVRGEVFSRSDGRPYREVLESAFAAKGPKKKVAGFKIFYYHARGEDSKGVWQDLVQRPRLHVLHLKRKNPLRAVVSREIASQRGEWRVREGERGGGVEKKAVVLNPGQVIELIEETRKWEEWGDRFFSGCSTLELHYESLVSDQEGECARVFRWLGLEEVPVETDLIRQNPESLRDLIENYDQVRAALEPTPWADLLQES